LNGAPLIMKSSDGVETPIVPLEQIIKISFDSQGNI
jgi:hypothetical protein